MNPTGRTCAVDPLKGTVVNVKLELILPALTLSLSLAVMAWGLFVNSEAVALLGASAAAMSFVVLFPVLTLPGVSED